MDNSSSVYELITALCEKYANATDDQHSSSKMCVQRLRSKCFEVLLSKRHSDDGKYYDLIIISFLKCSF